METISQETCSRNCCRKTAHRHCVHLMKAIPKPQHLRLYGAFGGCACVDLHVCLTKFIESGLNKAAGLCKSIWWCWECRLLVQMICFDFSAVVQRWRWYMMQQSQNVALLVRSHRHFCTSLFRIAGEIGIGHTQGEVGQLNIFVLTKMTRWPISDNSVPDWLVYRFGVYVKDDETINALTLSISRYLPSNPAMPPTWHRKMANIRQREDLIDPSTVMSLENGHELLISTDRYDWNEGLLQQQKILWVGLHT